MFRLFLERMLVGPTGFFTAGVAVKLAGVPHLLFAQLTNLLSDGDGHRMAFDWKGAGSLHPCFKHKNVWKKASGIERPTTISPLNNLGDSRSCCAKPDEFVAILSVGLWIPIRWHSHLPHATPHMLISLRGRVATLRLH